jgi:AcrR family transcriptional regulator
VSDPVRRRPYANTYDKRRQQVLQSAWDYLASHGDEEFNLRDISERSGVSLRTIYNAFENREGLIAQALLTHHASLFSDVAVGPNDSRSLVEAVEMCRRVAVETIASPCVAITTSRVYFASQERTRVLETLQELPATIVSAWMRSDEADQACIALFGEQDVCRQFANAQWALMAEWVAGALTDEEFSRQQQRTILAVGLAFGNADGRAVAGKLLAEKHGNAASG